jgi:hypothetical protein
MRVLTRLYTSDEFTKQALITRRGYPTHLDRPELLRGKLKPVLVAGRGDIRTETRAAPQHPLM